jgi:hypothetical protein
MEVKYSQFVISSVFFQLCQEFEAAISTAVKASFPRAWNEDTLSYNILAALRKPAISSIKDGQQSIRIGWDAFKFNGKIEQHHGDIAVIVAREVKQNEPLIGVGFLEAKKRYLGEKNYIIRPRQLKKILEQTPHAFILLYDHEEKDIEIPLFPIPSIFLIPSILRTQVFAVPANLIFALKSKQHITQHGLPFSYVLCYRFFQGYDLHFDKSIIEKVINRAEEFGGISYIVVATIGDVDENQIPQPNDAFFVRLE